MVVSTKTTAFWDITLGGMGVQRNLERDVTEDSAAFTETGTHTTRFVQCFQNSFAKQTLPTANT
jgi:hypothetical protein